MDRCALGKAQDLKLLFKLHNQKLERKETEKYCLLLNKGDWHKVFSLPIVELTIGSRENPVVYVTVVIGVFHSVDLIFVNSIIVDAE